MTDAARYEFFVLAAVLLAGCGALAWMVIRARLRVERVLGGARSSGDLINDLLQRVVRAESRLDALAPRLAAVEVMGQAGLQKVGFLRFNPFQDTGGDNSFIIVLLDADDTGFILSSLYMRETTRLYAKAVERGQVRQQLSAEEQHLLEDTIKRHATS
jgi:hypothetical protein